MESILFFLKFDWSDVSNQKVVLSSSQGRLTFRKHGIYHDTYIYIYIIIFKSIIFVMIMLIFWRIYASWDVWKTRLGF